MLGSEE